MGLQWNTARLSNCNLYLRPQEHYWQMSFWQIHLKSLSRTLIVSIQFVCCFYFRTSEISAPELSSYTLFISGVSFQFSSTSYSAMEGSTLPIVIQRYGQIATPVTLRVDTMNLTALNSAGPPHSIPPDVPPFDPLQPNIASSESQYMHLAAQ